MEANELKFWIAFNRVPHIGRARFMVLESYFGTMERAWHASGSELKDAGLDSKTAQLAVTGRATIDPDAEFERLAKNGVNAFTWHDESYPFRLKEIYDLPPVLYVRGTLSPEDERSVAVVGTRKASAYGREVAHRLSYDMARSGVTIVSGLARGIDGIAHRAALDAGKRTIAVLGSGIDVIYPKEHDKLASEIVQNGALISEHPLGTKPNAQNFPRRNRIMSGMTLGTIVIEAGEHSGALITARHALDEGREVFAVPGNIFSPNSRGVNKLIRESGAKLVSDYKDILEELNLSSVGQQIEMTALFPQDDNESQVLRYVTYDPVHIDEVIRESGMDIPAVSGALAIMELKGLVKQVGGMNYIRLKESPAEYEAVVR
ncbi:MAG: DNA-protecting protein DprA [Chloroflexi bacterium]|nr:DNA-protecting protein DprA [Chloroflexota bacterium]